MALSFDDFYTSRIGKGYDHDGAYGAQCWDGFAEYCVWLGVPIIHVGGVGARGLWENRATNGILNNFNVVSTPSNGTVGVWTNIYGGGYGHVAMYYNGQWMGQNQGGAAYPGGGACFNCISLAAPDGGYLHPKSMPEIGGETPTEKSFWMKIINGVIVDIREE